MFCMAISFNLAFGWQRSQVYSLAGGFVKGFAGEISSGGQCHVDFPL
jgi:hypothetical protein